MIYKSSISILLVLLLSITAGCKSIAEDNKAEQGQERAKQTPASSPPHNEHLLSGVSAAGDEDDPAKKTIIRGVDSAGAIRKSDYYFEQKVYSLIVCVASCVGLLSASIFFLLGFGGLVRSNSIELRKKSLLVAGSTIAIALPLLSKSIQSIDLSTSHLLLFAGPLIGIFIPQFASNDSKIQKQFAKASGLYLITIVLYYSGFHLLRIWEESRWTH